MKSKRKTKAAKTRIAKAPQRYAPPIGPRRITLRKFGDLIICEGSFYHGK